MLLIIDLPRGAGQTTIHTAAIVYLFRRRCQFDFINAVTFRRNRSFKTNLKTRHEDTRWIIYPCKKMYSPVF